jgi:hypothetical protein
VIIEKPDVSLVVKRDSPFDGDPFTATITITNGTSHVVVFSENMLNPYVGLRPLSEDGRQIPKLPVSPPNPYAKDIRLEPGKSITMTASLRGVLFNADITKVSAIVWLGYAWNEGANNKGYELKSKPVSLPE